MPDFVKIPAPIGPGPTQCLTCHAGTEARGFAVRKGIDSALQHPAIGTIQICAQCALDAARLFGAVAPEAHAKLQQQLEDAEAAYDALAKKLEDEQLNKVVPLADVVDFFTAYEEKHGHKLGETPKAAA